MNLIIMAPLGLTGLLGLFFAARAQDNVMYGHGLLLTAFCIAGVVWLIRRNGNTGRTLDPSAGDMDYNDEVIRAGVIASTFWGVVGFLAGVFIALQLAFPLLNLDLPWTTFRPAASAAYFRSNLRFRRQCSDHDLFPCGPAYLPGADWPVALPRGSCSGATSCSSSWRQPAMCSVLPRAGNMLNRNGMSISG